MGEAWGYRRNAFRNMSQLLGGVALQCYQETFDKEPESSRHLQTDATPQWNPGMAHLRATPTTLAD